jgi:predicted ThiF/HesA family dinucleotide-utilizing enzyme
VTDILHKLTGHTAAEYPNDALAGFAQEAWAALNEPVTLAMAPEKLHAKVAEAVAIIKLVHDTLTIRRSMAAWAAENGAVAMSDTDNPVLAEYHADTRH